jgi:polar amino acid transport system substrate-binding protein
MKDGDGQLIGFTIDLWNAVAKKLDFQTTYLVAPDVHRLFDALSTNRADIAVTPTYYTKDLDDQFDFSFPVLNAGFLVVVPDRAGLALDNPFVSLLHVLVSPVLLLWLGFVILFILIPAHLFWLLDRGSEESVSPSKGYFPGILHAMVWSATALVSQVQKLPSHHVARVLGLVWMFIGVVFVAFYTAQMTANLTVQQIRGSINGPEDLPGKWVGAQKGSHAFNYAMEIRAKVRDYKTFDEEFDAVVSRKVEAAIVEAPVARFYASHDGSEKVVTVGDEFHRHDLGFVLPLGSALLRPIDDALISLKEDGTYDQLYSTWFGRF